MKIEYNSISYRYGGNGSEVDLNVVLSQFFSFLTWVEKEILFLQQVAEIISRKPIPENSKFNFTLEMFRTFSEHYKNDFRISAKGFLVHFLNEKFDETKVKKLIDFIRVIKKPYIEVRNYPISKKADELELWFDALSDALETATTKMYRFALKLGIPWEPIHNSLEITAMTMENVSTYADNQVEKVHYNAVNLNGGGTPSSSAA